MSALSSVLVWLKCFTVIPLCWSRCADLCSTKLSDPDGTVRHSFLTLLRHVPLLVLTR